MYYSVIISFIFILLEKYVTCEDYRSFLSSNTPYRFIENNNTNVPCKECEVKKTWMMIRHGSRYPAKNLLRFMQDEMPNIRDNILKYYERNAGPLTEEQLDVFRTWSPLNESLHNEKYLSFEGSEEMEKLAMRMQRRFHSLFPNQSHKKNFKFKHTPTQRTFESAKHFAIGLFGEKTVNNIDFISSASNDSVLRFYKGCESWEKSVKKNPKTYEQLDLYIQGQEMKLAIKNISAMMGYDSYLNFSIAKSLYETCAYEQSVWNEDFVSPWCFLFKIFDLQVFEYAADLKKYYTNGYGYLITRQIPCNVMRDIISFFQVEDSVKNVFYFTHSGTVSKTLSYLGLFNTDGALKFDIRDTNRAWRTSYIDAFGSNLEFILYDCDGVDKVLVMYQERPVLLPECDEFLCPLKTIIEFRRESLDNCDIEKLCAIQ